MNGEIYCTDYEDFVVKLYNAIKQAANEHTGLHIEINPSDCIKWRNEHITNIECS